MEIETNSQIEKQKTDTKLKSKPISSPKHVELSTRRIISLKPKPLMTKLLLETKTESVTSSPSSCSWNAAVKKRPTATKSRWSPPSSPDDNWLYDKPAKARSRKNDSPIKSKVCKIEKKCEY